MKGFRHIYVAIALSSAVSSYAETCTTIPAAVQPGSDPYVTFCEDNQRYKFDIAGDQLVYDKMEFQQRINTAIATWWINHKLPVEDLEDTPVDIWFSAPEAAPRAAQARAVLFTRHGNVSLSFDIRDNVWGFTDQTAGVLGDETYPKTYGWRPKQVLIGIRPDAPIDQVRTMARAAGIEFKEEIGHGWYLGESAIFFEEQSIASLLDFDRSGFVKSAQLNTLMEWIALRGRTAHFTWQSTHLLPAE